MKRILILFIGVLIISCNHGKKRNPTEAVKSDVMIEKSKNFDWLLGKWKRINEEEGRETFENWNKITEIEYSGIGFTMQKGDTIKKEEMLLIQTNGNWKLTVKVPEEYESVIFNNISHNETDFTFENTKIDFPNKIKYWKNGDKINASISSSEMEILFEFEKLN